METGRHAWVLAFIPLIFVSLLSVAVCVWSMRHDREYDLELFCAVNVVQFVLIALRLDGFIGWSWSLVLTPLWFVLSFCVFGVLYAIVFALVLIKSSDIPVRSELPFVCKTLLFRQINSFLFLLNFFFKRKSSAELICIKKSLIL